MNDKYRMLTKIVRNMGLKKKSNGKKLNDNEAESLRYISKHNGCMSSDIVNYLNVDKALITRIIKKLEKLDLIKIEEGTDKRKNYLYITDIGLNLKTDDQLFEIEYYKSLFTDIDAAEQELFFKTLEKIYLKSKELRKKGYEKKIR